MSFRKTDPEKDNAAPANDNTAPANDTADSGESRFDRIFSSVFTIGIPCLLFVMVVILLILKLTGKI